MEPSIQAFQESPGESSPQILPEALRDLGPDQLLVNEFYLSIQGESSYTGRPCFFIRLAGCHLRCSWCDTSHAFHRGEIFTIAECLERSRASGVSLVEVTGGEPLLQPAIRPLLEHLADSGFLVILETSGAVEIVKVDPRVVRIVDVKCPGSGMVERNLPHLERRLAPSDELKFVIADRDDYRWARSWIQGAEPSLPSGIPIHFSPAFGRLKPDELAGWILEDRLNVRLNLQLHKIIWDPGRRGV